MKYLFDVDTTKKKQSLQKTIHYVLNYAGVLLVSLFFVKKNNPISKIKSMCLLFILDLHSSVEHVNSRFRLEGTYIVFSKPNLTYW